MKIKKICLLCGNAFTSSRASQIYCCSACRSRAFRNRENSEPEPEPEQNANAGRVILDKSGAALMAARRKYGLNDPRYWRAFQDYELERGNNVYVNGVFVRDPDFSESVIYTISTDGLIVIRGGEPLSE